MSSEGPGGYLRSVPDRESSWEPIEKKETRAGRAARVVVIALAVGLFAAFITFLAGPLGLVAATGFGTAFTAIALLDGRSRRRLQPGALRDASSDRREPR